MFNKLAVRGNSRNFAKPLAMSWTSASYQQNTTEPSVIMWIKELSELELKQLTKNGPDQFSNFMSSGSAKSVPGSVVTNGILN